ncbi:MAG: hypothetical protein KKG47_10785 [Proteobacteria bacterium]|nr:hypothetical protein [Pseudomonadota bacterium]MBU1738589.1 hypothetical protein [Pseudomonadota bacterium]
MDYTKQSGDQVDFLDCPTGTDHPEEDRYLPEIAGMTADPGLERFAFLVILD